MKQLNSNNYEKVDVSIKGSFELITMPADRGLKLMQYLAKENGGTHIQITDINGNSILVNRYEITRVVPVIKTKELKEYI